MNMSFQMRFLTLLVLLLPLHAWSKDIKTNGVHMANAPEWLTQTRVEKVVDHIQSKLEWDIRRIEVYWYKDDASYAAVNPLGPAAVAFARRSDSTVHLGPRVTSADFDPIFGHELVHVISHQKYHDAIPKWIEEGLANYLSQDGKVDYKWLASQPMPADVRGMEHPFDGAYSKTKYHYLASQALTEMIAAKCDLSNLLRLSVGRKLDDKLDTYCGIKDINAEFKKWINARR